MSISTASSQVATLTRYKYVAVGSETSVSGVDANGSVLAYTVGMEQVYLNGVMLVRGSDYTASSGTSITGLTALAANDIVEILTFSPFNITNAVDQTLVNAKGDLIVGTADNVVTNLAVGTNNYALVADSTQTAGVKWAVPTDTTKIALSTVTAKGDVIAATASGAVTNIAVGSSLQTFIPDSTQTAGVRWGDDLLVLQFMQAI